MPAPDRYVPALHYRILTPIYDPLLKLAMRQGFYMDRLIEHAQLTPGMRVLDVGCGTATLIIKVKQKVPDTQVTGLDGDPEILAIAAKKAAESGLDINFDRGMAYSLPYPDGSFERVFSSMMMHHLSNENKRRMLDEVCRVLVEGGEFHLVDFGVPSNGYTRLIGKALMRLENVQDNIEGRIITALRSGSFSQAEELGNSDTFFGTLTFYRAVK